MELNYNWMLLLSSLCGCERLWYQEVGSDYMIIDHFVSGLQYKEV